MATSSPATTSASRSGASGLLVLGFVISALFYYKWGGSLRTLAAVEGSGKLAISPGTILDGGVVSTTLGYFSKIWIALVYGILIGAAVRTAIPAAWVRRLLGANGAQPTVVGAMAGAPLMLCSCCITPVFTGLHQRGARLGPSLAVMLASPGLNIAALALTFALLPARVGLLRVAAALTIVLGLSVLVGRSPERGLRAPPTTASELACGSTTWRQFVPHFIKSVGYSAAITVPLILAGVILSSLLLPHVAGLTQTGTVIAVLVVALVGTLTALPTFFEIAIALLFVSLSVPVPIIVAFVIAGPIVNLPSLLVLARETSPRVAIELAVSVWIVAAGSGLVAMM